MISRLLVLEADACRLVLELELPGEGERRERARSVAEEDGEMAAVRVDGGRQRDGSPV